MDWGHTTKTSKTGWELWADFTGLNFHHKMSLLRRWSSENLRFWEVYVSLKCINVLSLLFWVKSESWFGGGCLDFNRPSILNFGVMKRGATRLPERPSLSHLVWQSKQQPLLTLDNLQRSKTRLHKNYIEVTHFLLWLQSRVPSIHTPLPWIPGKKHQNAPVTVLHKSLHNPILRTAQ